MNAGAPWVPMVLAACLSACSALAPKEGGPAQADASSPAVLETRSPPDGAGSPSTGEVLARDTRLLIYRPAAGETWGSIAQRWLGDARRDWEIVTLNAPDRAPDLPRPGQPLIVPLQPINPLGVYPGRLQTVQILCYHRIGGGSGGMASARMNVSHERFAEQLEWLAHNGYRVISLSDVAGFLAGRRALPPRSVVLTFDDGYESFHRLVWPLLRRYGFPATVFVYTDFVGAPDALSWSQMRELAASGLVDLQAHSRSHGNLAQRGADESDLAWRERIDQEVRQPREVLARQLGVGLDAVNFYAYPFGDSNETSRAALLRHRYDLAVTVTPGSNTFYAHPLMLRRTMIFGSHDLETFKTRLQTERAWPAPR